MSARDLRTVYSRSFRNLPRSSAVVARLVVASVLLQLVLSAAGVVVAVHLASTMWGYGLAAILAVFVGTRLRALNNIVHECSHNTFAATRDVNVALGRVCASVLLGSFEAYREEHLTHHMHLGDYAHDLDLQGIEALRLHDPLTPVTILRHVLTPLVGRHLPYYLSADLSARDGRWTRIVKVSMLAATVTGLIFFPIPTLVAVVVPRALVYTTLNYWTDCLDHAGLLENDDELRASRNVLAPLVVRKLFFPRNDCFHLVHHLFPQVPSHHLEECHRTLMASDSYARATNASSRAPEGPNSTEQPERA